MVTSPKNLQKPNVFVLVTAELEAVRSQRNYPKMLLVSQDLYN